MSFAPTLICERVVLRPVTLADVPALYAVFGDAEVMRYWSTSPFAKLADAESLALKIISGYEAATFLQLGIVEKKADLLIGTCTIFAMHEASRRAELGYALHRDYWGQGLMSEALDGIVNYAFTTLGLNRLEADIDPQNHASAKSLTRLGFKLEGFMPERWIVNDAFSDSAVYGLLKRDWVQHKAHKIMRTPHQMKD
jgi:[ribosomal protein S5]-alanine N-acetyltransferase